MDLLQWILSLIITGVVFGALGRLAVPGPNPLSIGVTILAGIGGAFLGSLVARLLGAELGTSLLLYFVLQVLGAAVIVYALSRRPLR